MSPSGAVLAFRRALESAARKEEGDDADPFVAALNAIIDRHGGVSSPAHGKRLAKVVEMATQAPLQLVVLTVRAAAWFTFHLLHQFLYVHAASMSSVMQLADRCCGRLFWAE